METRRLSGLVGVLLVVMILCPPSALWAWWTHNQITRWALDVVPEADRWQQALGAGNYSALQDFSWMPDQRDMDLGAFYADDYLFIRAIPFHVITKDPEVREAYGPFWRRVLQALRTETPVNAARQMGPLLHFVQDAGSPAHTRDTGPYHPERENWAKTDANIAGYQPQLLGKNDDAALAALEARLTALVTRAGETSDRVLPLIKGPNPDRKVIDAALIEQGQECARVTADLLYTWLTLGLAPQPAGADLVGTVTAPEMPLRNDHGARVVLLDTDYSTLATTAGKPPAGSWQGEFRFHHLPAGTYRLLVYRTAAQPWYSEPVTLKTGETTTVPVTLPATDPAGNLVENPDGRLSYLKADEPDRWRPVGGAKPAAWGNMPVVLTKGHSFRCGATLRDPQARAKLWVFVGTSRTEHALQDADGKPLECQVTADQGGMTCQIVVETTGALPAALEKAWVVPAPAATN